MKYLTKLAGIVLSCLAVASTMNAQLPWKNGKLEVSAEGQTEGGITLSKRELLVAHLRKKSALNGESAR